MQRDEIRKKSKQFFPAFGICWNAFFQLAHIDDLFQIQRAFFQLLRSIQNHQLHHGRAADCLLHPQLAALHPACQVHFPFTGQQRHGSHFAQVHTNRIVRVDGFFYGLLWMEEVRFRRSLWIKEFSRFLVEVNIERTFV